MSGPYRPSDYPGPSNQGGWGNGPYTPPGGRQFQPGPPPVPGPVPGGNWGGEPPRPKRSAGRLVVAIVSVLVIVGGVTTAVILLVNRGDHGSSSAAGNPGTAPTTQTSAPDNSDQSKVLGTASPSIQPGQCAGGAVQDGHYMASIQATCGAQNSMFSLDKTVDTVDGCAAREYVPLQAGERFDCFTLDLKQGQCTDSNYLKLQSCSSAAYTVLAVQAGPPTDSSCHGVAGATRWIPVGSNPPKLGCIGPPKTSS